MNTNGRNETSSVLRHSVGLIGAGNMGTWVAARLIADDADVSTVLTGRSVKSKEAAAACGISDAGSYAALVETSDIILSLVPPSEAHSVAQEIADKVVPGAKLRYYLDLNAVSSHTVQSIAALFAGTQVAFLDGSILGAAPAAGTKANDPRFYISGPSSSAFPLLKSGLNMSAIGAIVGAASSLKCCFAGISKGFTALVTEAIIAAERAGVSPHLVHELTHYAPNFGELIPRLLPDLFKKAPRWVAEMQEIGKEFSGIPGGVETFVGISALFSAMAAQLDEGNPEIQKLLQTFLGRLSNGGEDATGVAVN